MHRDYGKEREERAREERARVRAAVDLVRSMLASNPYTTPGQALDLLLKVHNRLIADGGARAAPAPPPAAAPIPRSTSLPPAAPIPRSASLAPAVPIKESVTDDYIVCLEDGSQHKLLERHLRGVHGLTPEEYRERWHLPPGYPMVAPRYLRRQREAARAAQARRESAREIAEDVTPTQRKPAVPLEESVTDDYIVCLEDGERRVMLKRHLRHAYNLTPEAYRARWGLPPDYPMVAPGYSRRKREEAYAVGLGTAENKRGKKAGAAADG